MITVNNKYSKIFGNYINCTAYEYNNLTNSTSYEVAGVEISSDMPTSIFSNSYNLYLTKKSDTTSYIKYGSSTYTLVEGSYNYSYATFDGLLDSYNGKINDIIVKDIADNDGVCYVCVGKLNGSTITKKDDSTETALGYIDLQIDYKY